MYRVSIEINGTDVRSPHTPVEVELDFERLFPGASPRPETVAVWQGTREVPFRLSDDFRFGNRGKVLFVVDDPKDLRYAITVDTETRGVRTEHRYLPAIGIIPTLLLWTLSFGVGEEVGWRGFALPRLQAGRTAFSASIFLGAFWAIWHLPALFYRDTYLEMGLLVIPMLVTVAAVGSTVYTWMYNGTGGSLLLLVVLHGLFDFFSVWPAGMIGPGVVMTVLLVFWAVRVYRIHGPADLSPGGRVTA